MSTSKHTTIDLPVLKQYALKRRLGITNVDIEKYLAAHPSALLLVEGYEKLYQEFHEEQTNIEFEQFVQLKGDLNKAQLLQRLSKEFTLAPKSPQYESITDKILQQMLVYSLTGCFVFSSIVISILYHSTYLTQLRMVSEKIIY